MLISNLFFGFLIGSSLIIAIGPQNVFVIEQGLKKQFVFLVCLICSISDAFLIIFGLFIFTFFKLFFNHTVEIILNISLIIFLVYFIWGKYSETYSNVSFNTKKKNETLRGVLFKTLGFTYLNPHVYSDTVFFLGNFSKNFTFYEKVFFGTGASLSSFIFFFSIGYLSKTFAIYLINKNIIKTINLIIMFIMSIIVITFSYQTIKIFINLNF